MTNDWFYRLYGEPRVFVLHCLGCGFYYEVDLSDLNAMQVERMCTCPKCGGTTYDGKQKLVPGNREWDRRHP